ncbi:MAG: AAA family ATPase, partial [Syntrophales bacterium LBB04]|nr:AAA family ATPase [Syntrophales bacterium LBB04]
MNDVNATKNSNALLIKEAADRFRANVSRVMVGKENATDLVFIALLSEGHVLVEDVPGVGKTLLAKATARSLECIFKRIQCTPDLLPSDVLGIYFFNQKNSEFELRPGPIFANIVLVDEINRAMPRTQSSLLECMQEQQVTVDWETMRLPRPFMIMATQNPIELEGTFPLPEAQLDRFLLKVKLGYPSKEEETRVLVAWEWVASIISKLISFLMNLFPSSDQGVLPPVVSKPMPEMEPSVFVKLFQIPESV